MNLYKEQRARDFHKNNQNLITIINSISLAVVVTDTKTFIQMMNPVAETLTAWREDEALAKELVEIFCIIDQDTKEVITNLVTQVLQTKTIVSFPKNCTLIAKTGSEILIEGSIAPLRNRDAFITGTVLVFQDITQRKQVEAQLHHNAFYDALTTLPNRILFLDRLKQAFQRSQRRHSYHFAVLFLDLDGFKAINDCFGHSIGDNLLVKIAQRLKSCVRGGDTVSRFGGDEFAILLEDLNDVSEAIKVAKCIQQNLEIPIDLNEHSILMTASIGIALNNQNYDQPESLLKDADMAMYRVKERGKGSYAIFQAS